MADVKGKGVGYPDPDSPDTVTLTTTTQTDLKAAPGAGKFLHVTHLTASNTSSTAVRLDVKDGTTVKYSHMLAADGGGFVIQFGEFGWKLADNAALKVQLSAAVTDVRVTAHVWVEQ